LIPPKYVYEGDEDRARELRGFAQSQLEILRNSMRFQDLKQGTRVVKFDNGTIIELTRCFGLETAIVYVPVRKAGEEEEEKVAYKVVYITAVSVIKQGASPSVNLCEGAVLPFQPIEISGLTSLGDDTDYTFQIRGGVPPYTCEVTDNEFWLKESEDSEELLRECEAHVQAPLCNGGTYHGWLGGLEGITGMLYTLLGGGVVNKDICERYDGIYIYRGDIIVHVGLFPCFDGELIVTDICGNRGTVCIELGPRSIRMGC